MGAVWQHKPLPGCGLLEAALPWFPCLENLGAWGLGLQEGMLFDGALTPCPGARQLVQLPDSAFPPGIKGSLFPGRRPETLPWTCAEPQLLIRTSLAGQEGVTWPF